MILAIPGSHGQIAPDAAGSAAPPRLRHAVIRHPRRSREKVEQFVPRRPRRRNHQRRTGPTGKQEFKDVVVRCLHVPCFRLLDLCGGPPPVGDGHRQGRDHSRETGPTGEAANNPPAPSAMRHRRTKRNHVCNAPAERMHRRDIRLLALLHHQLQFEPHSGHLPGRPAAVALARSVGKFGHCRTRAFQVANSVACDCRSNPCFIANSRQGPDPVQRRRAHRHPLSRGNGSV